MSAELFDCRTKLTAEGYYASSLTVPPDALLKGRVVRERLLKMKRESVDAAMGKGESWCTKVINGEMGVRLDDLPLLLHVLHLKAVDLDLECVNPDTARAHDHLLRVALSRGSLLFEESE